MNLNTCYPFLGDPLDAWITMPNAIMSSNIAVATDFRGGICEMTIGQVRVRGHTSELFPRQPSDRLEGHGHIQIEVHCQNSGLSIRESSNWTQHQFGYAHDEEIYIRDAY